MNTSNASLVSFWLFGLTVAQGHEKTLVNVCLAASCLGSDRSTETSEVQVACPRTSQLPMSTWAGGKIGWKNQEAICQRV